MQEPTVAEARVARKVQQQAEAASKRASREARRAENTAIHHIKRPRVPSTGPGSEIEACAADDGSDHAPCLRVCVVGLGWYALRAHLPALASLEARGCGLLNVRVLVVALVSRSAEAHAAAERRLGHRAVLHASLAAALANPEVS
jgi:hypothetical protein